MIQVESARPLEEMEVALCRAAQRHGAHVLSITHFNSLLREEVRRAAHDAISFSICHSDLYGALLAADMRFAAFLPCRIVAFRQAEGVTLGTAAPKGFCHHLKRPDLERLVAPLETLLRELMEETGKPAAAVSAQPHFAEAGLGAHEGQMSMRGSIPQRIDCHGTKIEDLAGTGKIDSPGG